MKIALLSKADASGGGASRVAEELCSLLNANGHIAHHYLAIKRSDNTTARSLYGSFTWGRLFRRLHHLVKRVGFPELLPWELFLLKLQNIQQYDLLHFHDLSSAISPLTVKYLARRKPTIWTFHDCSPFTGGCLYPMDCQNYKMRCTQCPQLGTWPIDTKFDFTGFMQNIKRSLAATGNVTTVAPSGWMTQMATHSGLYGRPPQVIPYGINTSIFHPGDQTLLRQELGLSVGRPVILIVAAYINETRKGVHYALEAVRQMQHLAPLTVVLGHTDEHSQAAFAGIDMISTGYIADNELKAQYMAAADIFLFTSLADNLPLVILETMACGTPTVGFATGGVPEMVQHNQTGYLVSPKDVDGLVKGIELALSDNRAKEWGRNARHRAETLYSHDIFLQNHLQLYQTVIQNFKQ